MLFDSLQSKLLVLPDEVEIFLATRREAFAVPACPANNSTIGFEKRFNLGLRINSKEEFVRYLTSNIPRPANMDRIAALIPRPVN